ncbi:aminotransferase class III-fold pyridoxal phosphate-dependent enzyme [Streptomyces sp. JW3]|uniref:aminotransferase class III-fold pyridoxal phosphate-dependent enzyme n=1 Tax=Streptomyces sp. JW3 TaxID=3456955 RepID=UPI003FA4B8AF
MTPGAYEGAARRPPAREAAARTYPHALPIVPVRARGLTVEGPDGRRYLDCLSGAGTLALGHNHPVVLEAIRAVLDAGAPLQAPGLPTPVKDAFVDELRHTLPPALARHARVRFCGPCETDALDTAAALVRAATGRPGMVACGAGEPAGPWTGPEPAGLFLAPVSDEDLRPVSDDRMRRTRRLTAERSVALIADERSTGVGRTGAYWAVDHAGVVPDVLVLAKAIGGSLPLSVGVHHDALDPGPGDLGARTAALCGNQLAMAAGTATLAHVRENRLAEHAAALGAGLLGRLRELAGSHPCVGEVRGRGLMIGIEFVRAGEHPLDGRRPAPELAAAVQRECLRRGLIVGIGGRSAHLVRLLPPLTTTKDQAAAVLDRLADAVDSAARGHRGRAPADPHPG